MIQENISIKNKLEEKLYEMLTKGLYKYTKRIFEKKMEEYGNNKLVYQHFQKKLYKIAKWSDKTITVEYLNFISWCNRHYNINEIEIENMIKKIILLSTQIMINKSRIYTENFLSTYEFPKLKTIYYKCLKKIARIFYENPKSIYDISLQTLKENLQTSFYNMIPIKKITDYLENKQDSIIIEKEIVEYNFDKEDTNSSTRNSNNYNDNEYNRDNQNENDNYKNDNDNDNYKNLKYVCSDDFKLSSESNNLKDVVKKDDEEDNIKHIRIPKLNKMYLKKKIDQEEDHFFD
jgi:hypothetical protein